MVSMPSAVRRVKAGVERWVSERAVVEQCRQVGYVWRRGELGPTATLWLFITQVLHGNTAIEHLRHLASMTCSASAYCQARMRLPLQVIEAVSRSVGDALLDGSQDVGLWLGHRVWHPRGSMARGSRCRTPRCCVIGSVNRRASVWVAASRYRSCWY